MDEQDEQMERGRGEHCVNNRDGRVIVRLANGEVVSEMLEMSSAKK